MSKISGLTIAEIPDLSRNNDFAEEVTSFLADVVWRGYLDPEFVRLHIRLGHTVAAFDDSSNLVGAGVFKVNRRRQIAELDAFGVSPEHRGLGLARELIGEVEGLAVNNGATRLEVTPGPGSSEFYEHMGYLGESPAMYKMLA